jgi:hypothetical protein
LRVEEIFFALRRRCSTLPVMLQRNEENTVPSLEARRSWTSHEEHRDALVQAKDEIIIELKAQVALLRDELKRKDAVLSRIAENIGELSSASVPEAVDGPQTVTPGGVVWVGDLAPDGQRRQEKPALPSGYRVVATASDAWVLVAPRGLRVAGYRGELDLWKVALDAREHHRREG